MKKLIFTLSFFLLSLGYILAQTREITGVVLDENGKPIAGSTVMVKDTKIVTSTNAAGTFTINVPDGSDTLEIFFIGMSPQKVPVTPNITVKMQDRPEVILQDTIISMDLSMEEIAAQQAKGDKSVKTSQIDVKKAEGMALLYQTISGFDKECFLIGTLNDYLGHQQTFESLDSFYLHQVDIYSQHEEKISAFIDSLFNKEYPDIYTITDVKSSSIRLYSSSLAKIIDGYYNYRPTIMMTMSGDTVYTGIINKEKIKTESQKLSFLAGFYLRYGTALNNSSKIRIFRDIEGKEPAPNTYWIRHGNSLSKAQLSMELLNEFKCGGKRIIKRNSIPVVQWLFFIPSEKIQRVIEAVDTLQAFF